MKSLFDKISYNASRNITRSYSTSFSLGIRLLHSSLREPIYNIYGFVRVADEIVDTFHDYNKEALLKEFWNETHLAIERGISTNPVLNAFQVTVRKYNIGYDLIDQFLKSMEMDLSMDSHDQDSYEEYILGSAQVVGLMCLKVFVDGDEKKYQELKPYAMSLGSAFQKVNFLRDLKDDSMTLGRLYFPQLEHSPFNESTKKEIEADIQKDFAHAYSGIMKLPQRAKFGVYLSYIYYTSLFEKIKNTQPQVVKEKRIRIPNNKKVALLFESYVKNQMGLL